ncbi:hypothetical protein D9619_011618 [Psilocybe cf. subviscida]|uniref:HAT C-terminal dimerisation domain-containing protein n=1 Tax=Psilocybe cf. subviscida TaxID=2480587 RepID=A0A8H5BS93_9AGAR|nr:hypothetical protein D9619_011618 [Psilocybe cf. subviscida]
MDVLPTQASAVPCERVFSSSKETDTDRRANLSPERMEHLQILKTGYRGSRVTFTDDLLADTGNHEVSIIDAPLGAIDDLYQEGRIIELDDLVNRSWGPL